MSLKVFHGRKWNTKTILRASSYSKNLQMAFFVFLTPSARRRTLPRSRCAKKSTSFMLRAASSPQRGCSACVTRRASSFGTTREMWPTTPPLSSPRLRSRMRCSPTLVPPSLGTREPPLLPRRIVRAPPPVRDAVCAPCTTTLLHILPTIDRPWQVSFLEKNNDTLQEDWLEQLSSSSVPLLNSLFLPAVEATSKAGKKASSFSSVGKRFVSDLNALLAELKASKAHFVRCVKPCAASKPKSFEAPLVLDQLRCAGVVEAVRVMTEAFPTRIPYEVIHGRYAPLMGQEVLESTGDEPAAFCEAVALACDVAPRDYALGLTKLFLKAGCGGFLEDLATMDTAVVVPLLVRKIAESKRKKGAERIIGHTVHGWYVRKKYNEKRAAAALAQHKLRSIKAKREYRKWSEARQERLAAEAADRARKEAEEAARRDAEEAARKVAEEAQLKEAAVAEAIAKAKAEAEARVAAEMAAAVKEVEAAEAENAARNAAKQSLDRKRPDWEGRRQSSQFLTLRRGSASTLSAAEMIADPEDAAIANNTPPTSMTEEPSLAKARSEYSVTQVRHGRSAEYARSRMRMAHIRQLPVQPPKSLHPTPSHCILHIHTLQAPPSPMVPIRARAGGVVRCGHRP